MYREKPSTQSQQLGDNEGEQERDRQGVRYSGKDIRQRNKTTNKFLTAAAEYLSWAQARSV